MHACTGVFRMAILPWRRRLRNQSTTVLHMRCWQLKDRKFSDKVCNSIRANSYNLNVCILQLCEGSVVFGKGKNSDIVVPSEFESRFRSIVSITQGPKIEFNSYMLCLPNMSFPHARLEKDRVEFWEDNCQVLLYPTDFLPVQNSV